MSAALAETIDALLPQTQCRRCGYDGCLPYAQALAAGRTGIDRCPPGGPALVGQLALLLQCPAPAGPAAAEPPSVAWIDEPRCIGCYKCIAACPVDAIVGARGLMHSVVAAECSGCALCAAPCPVDCIELRPRPPQLPAAAELTGFWRGRHQARQQRLARRARERADARRRGPAALREQAQAFDIAAAIARARARRAGPPGPA